MKFIISALLVMVTSPAWGKVWKHLEGMPKGYTQQSLKGGVNRKPMEVLGTLNPPRLVVNGKELSLTPSNRVEKTGVYFNGEKIPSKGQAGRFYKSMVQKRYEILLSRGNETYSAFIEDSQLFFEKSFSQLRTFADNENKNTAWVLQGDIPTGVEVFINGQAMKPAESGKTQLKIPHIPGKHQLSVKIKSKKGIRTLNLPYEISENSYDSKKTVLSVNESREIDFTGGELELLVQPGAKVSFGNETETADEKGYVGIDIPSICDQVNEKGQTDLNLVVNGDFKKIPVSSPGCPKYKRLKNSRFHLAVGFLQVGVMDSGFDNVKAMYTEFAEPGPKFSLAARVYDRVYFEARAQRLGAFRNSDQKMKAIGAVSFWLGYPWRGRWFGAIGVHSFKTDYNDYSQQNFSFENVSTAGVQGEFGFRWMWRPRWDISTRVIVAPPFLALQNEERRKWGWAILELLTFEVYF